MAKVTVFAKFVGASQKRLDGVETVGDIRTQMGASSDVSISKMVGNGAQLSDDTAVEANELYLIATKTEGSAKETELLASIDKGRVTLTKNGAKYYINGELITKAQMKKLVNAFAVSIGFEGGVDFN